jgi:hypothetical protein
MTGLLVFLVCLCMALTASAAGKKAKKKHGKPKPPAHKVQPPPPEPETETEISWYVEFGMGALMSFDEPWPGNGDMAGGFVGAGGVTVRFGGPAVGAGLRIEPSWLYRGFFDDVGSGRALSYMPEVRLGLIEDSELGQPAYMLVGAPRFGTAELGGTSADLSGYHVGLMARAFRFRDLPSLGQAAILIAFPSTLEVSIDHYTWDGRDVSALQFCLRWAI